MKSKRENLVYLTMWVFILVLTIVIAFIRSTLIPEDTFHWRDILRLWQALVVYLVAFLIHNHCVAPFLIDKHSKVKYILSGMVLIAAIMTYQLHNRPDRGFPPQQEISTASAAGDRATEPGAPATAASQPPRPPRPPLGIYEVTSLMMLLTLLGTNLGIKYYYRTEEERERMLQLKAVSLQQELDYLRYQVNPHFFMNTLNNIHALVDIDPNQAKDSIIKLSKLMRYILYDGAKDRVSLERGINFLTHYITLMKMRYNDDMVKITLDVPQGDISSIMIPPMLFAPFIENAFKHGVSYTAPSFINIKVTIGEDRLLTFTCRNSINTAAHHHEQGGVGLPNVRRRLKLIYGDGNYELHEGVEPDNPSVYSMKLILKPL